MKAADTGLLSKSHVNQLHPIPHLRAEIQHKSKKAAQSEVRCAASQNDFCNLSGCNLFWLQPFGPTVYNERNLAALFERAISTGLNGRKMHKYIFAVLAGNEAISLTGVKPLYCSCLFH